MKFGLIGIVTASVLALSACVSSSGSTNPPLGAIRAVNAVSDSSTASVISGLTQIADMLSFGSASAFTVLSASKQKVVFNGTSADGNSSFTITVPNTPIDQYQGTTVYATGTVASPSSYIVEAPVSLTQGQVQLQLVDVASQLGTAVDIYIVPPTSDITNVDPMTTLQYLGNSSTQNPGDVKLNVTAGSYELIITANGSKTPLFDSGMNGIAFNSATSLQIALLDAPNQPNGSAISLLELDNTGQNNPVMLQNGAN